MYIDFEAIIEMGFEDRVVMVVIEDFFCILIQEQLWLWNMQCGRKET